MHPIVSTTEGNDTSSAGPRGAGQEASRRPPARRRRTKLRLAGALLLATAAAVAAVTATGLSPAGASTRNWVATGWNIHLLNQASPALASHFFNTPGSFGTGGDPTTGPVSDGFATSPVLTYTSYAQFASAVQAGAITYPYHWVSYDPEAWTQTPLSEQQNPRTYLRQFALLAHAHGYRVIEAPGRDLGLVPGATCAKQVPETLNHWYIRCGIARAAAAADVLVVQDQVNTTSPADYAWLYNNARAQAKAASPSVVVDAEVSTNYGTPAQMAAAARSVSADGYYLCVTAPAISQAAQFFKIMRAAGF
jgi:hypothetical protein